MIPTESSDIEEFVPPSLANLAAPPVFKLRPANGREFRKYQYVMRAEGLDYHTRDDFRAEMVRALGKLYSPEQAQEAEGRLRSIWEMVDQKVDPDPVEAEALDDLVARLTREWRPLATMGADNMRFQEESLRVAISMFLVGWSSFDLGYRREDGRVPLGLIDDLEDKLQGLEKKAIEDKVEGVLTPGIAFLELSNAAYRRLHLTGDEKKNSSSPPSSPPTRSGSTKRRSRKTAGASSKASASSESKTASSAAS